MDGIRVERTVVFADVAGSTRLYEAVGDETARELLLACLDVVAGTVGPHEGTVVDRIGDELVCLFPDPPHGVEAAAAMQVAVSRAFAEGRLSRPMRLRVGLVHGPVLRTDEGVFGTTVHAAARLSSLAKAGQILTMRSTLDRLAPASPWRTRLFDRVVLKGMAGEQEIHEVVWRLDATTAHVRLPKATVTTRGAVLRYGDQSVHVGAQLPRVEVGRDPACDLSVDGRAVSQLHARVLWDGLSVRVEDVSTNGTVVERQGREPVHLHHSGAPLQGSGVLRLGMADDADLCVLVEYRCDHGLHLES